MEIEYTTTRVVEAAERAISAQWTINRAEEIVALHNQNYQRELESLLAEQIAMDIDREILESFSLPEGILGSLPSKPRCGPEDFKDMESYREEILVKKYGFR